MKPASTPAKFTTVHSLLSPEDASKLSGRYETTAEVKGKSVSVLRSIRQANAKGEELVVSGSITPKKKAPVVPSAEELDCLCDLFSSKARVTPKKKKPASKKKVAKAEEAKEKAGGASKSKTKKTARFGEPEMKITVYHVHVSPASSGRRRSRSISK